MCGECYPHTNAFYSQQNGPSGEKRPDWHILDRISEDFYILCYDSNSYVRYAPLYIHNFVLCTPRKILEATQFNQRYHKYEDIQSVSDRLRWCRHSKGLMQSEVAKIAGVTRTVYIDIETGTTQHIPMEMAEKLANFYGVPMTDFMDEYNRFLHDGQAGRIRTYRESLGVAKKPFAREMGIPVSSLREWESGRKVISRKCWEQYFKGRA